MELIFDRTSPGLLGRARRAALWAAMALACCVVARAELQFDIFVGYDNQVREASWFPLSAEIFNDGPTFVGTIEISSGSFGGDQVRRVTIELPTNTRKRVTIPVFASGGRRFQYEARLLDERGKLRAERPSLMPTPVPWESPLLGSLSRAFAGKPSLPNPAHDRKPSVAALMPEFFPDNPIALEGLTAIYLNSEKALELREEQVSALLDWVNGGGVLIAAVEQVSDVQSMPWLRRVLPLDPADSVNLSVAMELHRWVATPSMDGAIDSRLMSRGLMGFRGGPAAETLAPDASLASAELPVATGSVRSGEVLLAVDGRPLVLRDRLGRGEVLMLTFSPEREPVRSWKHRPWLWSRLLEIPPGWYSAEMGSSYGGTSMDGVFGSLIDSRQVRKLPVEWLLALLLVYLVVIGPFDQWWLKKINRQMLTWITFPTYVVLFSLLIYFIGRKLRAGDTEWNELNVVDVLPKAVEGDLRGRSYISIYSSENARYQVASALPYATFRGELMDMFGGGRDSGRATIDQSGNDFQAEVVVPVWTSLLYVHDWVQTNAVPFEAAMIETGGNWTMTIENFLGRPLHEVRLVHQNRVFEIGTVGANSKQTVVLAPASGRDLESFVHTHAHTFEAAVNQRKNPLGSGRWHLDDPPKAVAAASFVSKLAMAPHQRGMVWTSGFELSPLLARGDAVLLAWDPGNSPVAPVNKFNPPRLNRNTIYRLAITPESLKPLNQPLEEAARQQASTF